MRAAEDKINIFAYFYIADANNWSKTPLKTDVEKTHICRALFIQNVFLLYDDMNSTFKLSFTI